MHRSTELRTVGVEEELLLVDPDEGLPAAVIESVLTVASQHDGEDASDESRLLKGKLHLESEAKQEQIEIVSPPGRTLEEIAASIAQGRSSADRAAREIGFRAVALGTSVLPVISQVARKPRFKKIRDRFGLTMKEQLTCGYHVHVSVESDEEGVAVLDRIRPWLPTLLALSSNSPLWGGRDTGYSSYRYQAWSRWPSAGPYDIFGSAEAYHRTLSSLVSTGVLFDTGMVYFDARLCEHYPTIEVRVADVCMDAQHAVAVAGLIRALVETAARDWRDGVAPEPLATPALRLAMWSASRYGLAENLVNPILGEPCEARVAIDALLAHVEPALAEAGDLASTVDTVNAIFRDGTGAERQCRVLRETGSTTEVVADAITVTNHADTSPPIGVTT